MQRINGVATRRGWAALLTAVSLVLAVGCSVVAPSNGEVVAEPLSGSGLPKLTWKGDISFFAQSYTPEAPGVQLAAGATKLHALQNLAVKFERLYPGIHIKFVAPTFQDTNQQVVSMAASGSMYDIYFNQYTNFNSVFPKGVVYNLAPYLNRPNPFIKGNTKWRDVMNPRVLSEMQAPGGQIYDINGDYAGVLFYYNRDLFAKAGITAPPTTWAGLLADCAKLKAHGIIPGADVPTYDWWVRIWLGNYLGEQTLKQISAYGNAPGISTGDDAVAYSKGIIDPTKNPKVMAWWPEALKLYRYWDPNVTVIPWSNPPPGAQNEINLFSAGKVAMIFDLSAVPSAVAAANKGKIPFKLGSFPFPSLAGVRPYGTSYDSSTSAGGPEAAFQYAVSTPKADLSMGQKGKLLACLAWLQYIATPPNDAAIVNELGSFVPSFVGAEPTPVLAPVKAAIDKPWYQQDGGQNFSPEGYTKIRDIFQQYVSGHLSFADAKKQYAKAIADAYKQYQAIYAHGGA